MSEIGEDVDKCPYCGHEKKSQAQDNTHALKPYSILQGKYLVGNVIGEGGFGITYIGFDLNLEIKIAVKEFYPNGYVTRESNLTAMVTNYTTADNSQYEKWKESFVKEARSLAKFSNLPGIVHVRDFFQENNTAYIVMEYVEGETLKSHLKTHGGKMSTAETLSMMRPVIQSLARVHEAGIIHRDISPDNIMIENGGSVRLIDFGAARDFGSEGEKSLSVLLKPGFAPEEQYRSKGNQGPWTDVYALCATIYRCITGEKPPESMERMRQDTIKSPSSLGAALSSAQEKALMAGLAVFAEKRIKTMGEFEAKLYQDTSVNYQTGTGYLNTGKAPEGVSRLKEGAGNRKIFVIAGAAVLALIVLIVIVIAVTGKKSKARGSEGDTLSDLRTSEEKKNPSGDDGVIEDTPKTWQEGYKKEIEDLNPYEWDNYSVTDVNDDGIPEIIVSGSESGTGRILMTWTDDGGTDILKTKGDTVTFSPQAGAFCDTYVDSGVAYDVVYSVKNSGFESIFDGSYRQNGGSFNGNGDPDMIYTVNGSTSGRDEYFDGLSQIYLSKKVLSVEELSVMDRDEVLRGLENNSLTLSSTGNRSENEGEWKFDFKEALQFFTAPYGGTYTFTLYGANGGSDNVNRGDYDYEAAVLCGDVSLKAGEKVMIITGGAGGACKDYYDLKNNIDAVVPGGYNGGGSALSSGGGGGCTDLYYNGVRIAAAAGSGGGNYDYMGTAGRTSGDSYDIMPGKNGGGDDTLDKGGGGAGWFGGIQGKDGEYGCGGVNGWDDRFFSMGYESAGSAYSLSGSRNGTAVIEYAGN